MKFNQKQSIIELQLQQQFRHLTLHVQAAAVGAGGALYTLSLVTGYFYAMKPFWQITSEGWEVKYENITHFIIMYKLEVISLFLHNIYKHI